MQTNQNINNAEKNENKTGNDQGNNGVSDSDSNSDFASKNQIAADPAIHPVSDAPGVTTSEDHPQKQVIVDMTAKRHQKIYLLKSVVGMKGSHIAKLLGTNPGHVGNVLKDYKDNPEKATKAGELLDATINPKPEASSSAESTAE